MKKTLIQWLGLLGVISLLSYTAAVVFSPLAYPGYNWMAQAVSDLMAENSPSKMLWNQLASLYGVCGIVSIMMVCVFIQGRLNKTLRLGIYLFAVMYWVSSVGSETRSLPAPVPAHCAVHCTQWKYTVTFLKSSRAHPFL